jgi:hypothetical protein
MQHVSSSYHSLHLKLGLSLKIFAVVCLNLNLMAGDDFEKCSVFFLL